MILIIYIFDQRHIIYTGVVGNALWTVMSNNDSRIRMIKRVKINGDLITDWDSFHDIFKKTFGFPDFYGRNMDAWIDCMTDIDNKDSGMTSVLINKSDTLVIELTNRDTFKQRCPDIYLALLECSSYVNFRKIDNNEQSIIAISAD